MTGRPFTDAEDDQIRELRQAGKSWDAIGKVIGRAGQTVAVRLLVSLGEPDPLGVSAPSGTKRGPLQPGEVVNTLQVVGPTALRRDQFTVHCIICKQPGVARQTALLEGSAVCLAPPCGRVRAPSAAHDRVRGRTCIGAGKWGTIDRKVPEVGHSASGGRR